MVTCERLTITGPCGRESFHSVRFLAMHKQIGESLFPLAPNEVAGYMTNNV